MWPLPNGLRSTLNIVNAPLNQFVWCQTSWVPAWWRHQQSTHQKSPVTTSLPTSHQSLVTSHQSPVTSHQSPVTSSLPTTSHQYKQSIIDRKFKTKTKAEAEEVKGFNGNSNYNIRLRSRSVWKILCLSTIVPRAVYLSLTGWFDLIQKQQIAWNLVQLWFEISLSSGFIKVIFHLSPIKLLNTCVIK